MKILQICHKPPLPAVDGGCIAINNITQGLLKQGHEVKVISIATPKHPFDSSKIPENYIHDTNFESIFINTNTKPLKAALSLLFKQSYQVNRFFSKELEQKIAQVLQKEEFDIIQLESVFVAPYTPVIRKYSQAKIVLRAHNVEHKIWGRFLMQQKSPIYRLVLRRMARQLHDFEYKVFEQIDGFLAISEPDCQFFKKNFPPVKGIVIPAGIDIEQYEMDEERIPSDSPKLFHIGSMNWMPNIEGLDWFFNEVWGKILAQFPDLTFTIAGRGIPKEWHQRNIPNLIIEGEVSDAKKFIESKDIMVVPLLSGSGVRIKILEGMALSKAIITTPIGAEGLNIEHGKNIFIANTPSEFVDIVAQCIAFPESYKIIGENAKDYVTLYHNNNIITEHLVSFYHEL